MSTFIVMAFSLKSIQVRITLSKLAANAKMNTRSILIPRIITSPPKKSYTWPEGWYLPGRINRHERRTRTV